MTAITRRTILAAPLALAVPALLRPSAMAQERWPEPTWEVVDPASVGMDPAQLEAAHQFVLTNMPDVTGVVAVRNGAIVHERYYGGIYGEDDPVKIRSITKSFTSALVGMLIDDGLITLDSTIGEMIPGRIPLGADPRTPEITLFHLLTMTSGWAWDISTDYQTLIAADNWVELTLSLPVVHEPGTYYAYNSGGSHLLSVIVSDLTGQDTLDFAQERLFGPLGISRPVWEQSPQGERVGGFGLELTPRNLAKFGLLYLREGEWGEERLVPKEYALESTDFQFQGDSTGYAGYGYQWWVVNDVGYDAFFGLGYGSQFVYVVPEMDLVVVVVKGFEQTPPVVSFSRPYIEGFIVPAVVER